ncbi:cobaltochelatase subunit CobN [Egibacter rhizosphaerae]|uniref:Cobaltochelatase subunit CobN n=1 Tax=Egibacter rhizosphaerae TaxID=1670831 RepID=A0A411YLA7_9ACTN|nr:cobaltochelatase subunit CobN [Egibacter rhizosphaerae]
MTLLTTADTELLAAARAADLLPPEAPTLSARNPVRDLPGAGDVDALLAQAPDVVVVRLLGGRRAWPDGLDRLAAGCRESDVPLVAVSGEAEADAELTALSTAPPEVTAEVFRYLTEGGVANTAQLVRYIADRLLGHGLGHAPPEPLPEDGIWDHRAAGPDGDLIDAGEADARLDPARPTVGIVFYRTHWMSGNTEFVAELCARLEAAGANALPVVTATLRPRADGHGDRRVPALDLVAGRVDALVVTVLASGGRGAADLDAGGGALSEDAWDAGALAELDVPIVQALCLTSSRAAWEASDQGVSPMDTAMQVAVPEFDGRLVTVPASFKELGSEGVPRYVPDSERCGRVAGIATRLARLRHAANADKRVAVVLSNYPTRHSRIGNGVGLDTPASAARLLDALTAAGYDTGDWGTGHWAPEPASTPPPDAASTPPPDAGRAAEDEVELADPRGDALVHALIAAGGFDEEFLTEEQLARIPYRLGRDRYTELLGGLPDDLVAAVTAQWGDAPGEIHAHEGTLCFAGLAFGNVLLAIQPPRGFGEDPVAIYHDPDLPPTHHYLGFYRWLDADWGADAVVHLGKHGTLEWLPGKSLGLSASCAPDAALGDLPLVYPFVVDDPGEGTQAKRRAHATIVDHLVPPMTRADTYDELTRLEQLLDEYEHVKAMDPAKAPALRGEMWQVMRAIQLDADLRHRAPHLVPDEAADAESIEPGSFEDLLVEVDGYLCELKDTQIRGGLHVLGAAPEGDTRRDLALAILRLPQAGLPGLRQALAAALGLDEAKLLDAPGQPVDPPPALAERGEPVRTAGDLVDRLEDVARDLLDGLAARDWDTREAGSVLDAVLPLPTGDAREEVEAVLRLAGDQVVPRLAATDRELARCVSALDGRFVPSGPSGAPTRGRLDVLPTGKNFYGVDPKALPSELSWQVGQRLADDLVRRHLDETGEYPTAVGLIVWGTAAMRTHGDDLAEILALLGVRPVWNRESRRVTGLELIGPAELGRPRVDVTARISGFFRDAFPHLVELVDDAVQLAADATDEPPEQNPIAARVAADELAGVPRRRATARVFGSKPGAYGAGLLPLVDAGNWSTDADLAEVYATWGGYAYGRGLDGEPARSDMERVFSRLEVAVKNTDTREHDLYDADDYFQYHGGMVATVRALTGASPRAYVGDSSDPARVATRDLAEETARVFRSRVVNPKWIEGMRRHGYKGAFEMAATVDYLFGYDATSGVVDDWMYERLAEAYVFDEQVAEFTRESNPWARRAITERLLEAADRGLWSAPDPDTLAGLRDVALAMEAELEDRTAGEGDAR